MLTTALVALSLIPIHILPPPRVPHHVRLPRAHSPWTVDHGPLRPRPVLEDAYYARLRVQLCEAKPTLFCDPAFLAGR